MANAFASFFSRFCKTHPGIPPKQRMKAAAVAYRSQKSGKGIKYTGDQYAKWLQEKKGGRIVTGGRVRQLVGKVIPF